MRMAMRTNTRSRKANELFISYWRCNYSKRIRIMRHEEFSTPSAVAEMRLLGDELTAADVTAAEALLEQVRVA